MPNVTLSMDEKLLEESRKYARGHGTTLNGLIRKLLARTIANRPSEDWLKETFQLMDKAKGNSKGAKWKREDLYDV